jgi:PAS domain S-box-containing protein
VTELAADQAATDAAEGAAALAVARAEIAELKSILETTTDGVLVLDNSGRILSANRGAQALFGYDNGEFAGRPLADLLADESEPVALAYLDGLLCDGVASVINDGREVVGRVRQGGLVPLFMTIARTGEGDRFCAVLRDITARKKAVEDLGEARRQADEASSLNTHALAKLSHEIRTPLNTIIGFSDVMMQERFGPVGNQRYRQYAKDIHVSADHLLSLVNEFVDLSRIEAGQIELTFSQVALNDVAQQCVAVMQPQANRERIIIRTSLSPKLPQVIADERSIRQIVLSLLSNSIRLTGPAGQVIVSTATAERGEVVLRVRDTGLRLSQVELGAVGELFRRPTEAGGDADRTGLGLPLAKALVEANRATFTIKSSPDGAGSLVEVSFPTARVLAE